MTLNADQRLTLLTDALVNTFGAKYLIAGTELEDALEQLRQSLADLELLRANVMAEHLNAQFAGPIRHQVPARYCTDACRLAAELL